MSSVGTATILTNLKALIISIFRMSDSIFSTSYIRPAHPAHLVLILPSQGKSIYLFEMDEKEFHDGKESFRLFVRAEDKMCDEGRVVRILMEVIRVMARNGDNSDGVEKMRAAEEMRMLLSMRK